MLKLCIGVALLLQAAPLQAQALRGRNDNGECVSPCSRAGGMPCQPCLPMIGPGSDDWEKSVAQVDSGNRAFLEAARERAEHDTEYRERSFAADRQAYDDVQRDVRSMREINRDADRDRGIAAERSEPASSGPEE